MGHGSSENVWRCLELHDYVYRVIFNWVSMHAAENFQRKKKKKVWIAALSSFFSLS